MKSIRAIDLVNERESETTQCLTRRHYMPTFAFRLDLRIKKSLEASFFRLIARRFFVHRKYKSFP